MPTLFEHPNYVERFKQKYSPEFAAQCIVDTVREKGGVPTVYMVAKALGQANLETEHFKECNNHNWGNVRRAPNAGPFTMIEGNEIINGKVVWFKPGDKLSCFAAYPTPEAGCGHWISVFDRERYVDARAALYDDSVGAFDFVWSLRNKQPKRDGKFVGGYYTAEPTRYSTSATKLFFRCLHDVYKVLGSAKLDPYAWLFEPAPVDYVELVQKLGFDNIIDFQRKMHLGMDGDIGRQTRAAMVYAAAKLSADLTAP